MHWPDLLALVWAGPATRDPNAVQAIPLASVLAWFSIAVSSGTLGWIAWKSLLRPREPSTDRDAGRLRGVLDELPEGVTILDRQGKVVWMTESTHRRFCWPVERIVGTSIFQLVHPDDQSRVAGRFADLVERTGDQETIEFRFRKASGEYVAMECTARNLLGAPGIDGILVSGRDLAERTLARHQLEESRLQAERLLAEKSEFLAILGHEVRTPLQAIFAALDAVHAQTRSGDAARELVEHASRSAESLLQILDDLLVMSRGESGLAPVRRVEFDPIEISDEIVGLFEVPVRKKGGSIRSLASRGPCRMVGDPARLRQILSNLVGNAVRYAGDTGIEIDFRPGTGEPPTEGVWEVRDRGPGLQGADASRLFRKWERGREDVPGSGLGLAIVADIVQSMKGTLLAFPREGGGLVVRLNLPLVAPEKPGSETHLERIAPRRPIDPKRPRVLVAEDDRTNQVVIRKQLDSLGCESVIAGDGAEALAQMERGEFDLVLLDCQMPVLDGFATAKEIRRLEQERERHRLPVLAVTAWAMHDDQQLCLQSGMDEVLTKPLRPTVLADALTRWLGYTRT